MNECRVKMGDVARAAGVHITTVSLALRNHPRLPETTRLRIQEVAQKLGYVPAPWLGALVAYRIPVAPQHNPPTLAYVTNWNTRWGWKNVTAHPDFFAGAQAKAKELGYNLEHFWLREPGLTHGQLNRILHARGINGVIIASHKGEIDVELQFDWSHLSGIKIDYFPHKPELHNVTNNQCDIIRLAMQKVIAAGYRRIGFVMHRGWDHAVDHLWTAGYLCEQQSLPPSLRIPPHLFPGPVPFERWYKESKADVTPDPKPFDDWMKRYRPEVVISKALFVLPLFERRGLRVPHDGAFVDLFLDEFSGKTAGVRQNHARVGALAVELLAGQLQHNKFGVPQVPTTTFVEGTWYNGSSCPMPFSARPRRRAAPPVLRPIPEVPSGDNNGLRTDRLRGAAAAGV